jgi:hypothetical protein
MSSKPYLVGNPGFDVALTQQQVTDGDVADDQLLGCGQGIQVAIPQLLAPAEVQRLHPSESLLQHLHLRLLRLHRLLGIPKDCRVLKRSWSCRSLPEGRLGSLARMECFHLQSTPPWISPAPMPILESHLYSIQILALQVH